MGPCGHSYALRRGVAELRISTRLGEALAELRISTRLGEALAELRISMRLGKALAELRISTYIYIYVSTSENYIRYAFSPKFGIFSPDWRYTSNLMYD